MWSGWRVPDAAKLHAQNASAQGPAKVAELEAHAPTARPASPPRTVTKEYVGRWQKKVRRTWTP